MSFWSTFDADDVAVAPDVHVVAPAFLVGAPAI